jgi:hypothetical protein
MSADPARPLRASGKARTWKSQDSSRCAAGRRDWMLVRWIQTSPAVSQRSMTAVMIGQLYPGADLFRLRRCPRQRYDAS